VDMDEDAPYVGSHFMIDDNTGMIESPDSTHTHTHPPPGNILIRKDEFSSSEEERDLDDMASGKESYSDDSVTFGEVPLESASNMATSPMNTPPSEENLPLHEKTLPPPPLFSSSLERACLALLVIANGIFCILVGFERENSALVAIGITCSSWITNLFGAVLIVLQISTFLFFIFYFLNLFYNIRY
jgi:hypothetical protein